MESPPKPPRLPLRVCLDVEVTSTSSRDIDDTLLLLLVAGDPRFQLGCVTVTPGTYAQVAVAQHILVMTGNTHVPVGAEAWPTKAGDRRKSLCEFALKLGGDNPVEESSVHDAATLLAATSNKNTVLLTGADLRNVASALDHGFICSYWLGQGGFASDSVLPPHATTSCTGVELATSYNLKCLEATKAVLSAVNMGRQIPKAYLVSSKRHVATNLWNSEWRNRMHLATQQYRDKDFTRMFSQFKGRKASLAAILSLDVRLGKALHDVLLVAVAINPSTCSWTNPVEVYHDIGEAGEVRFGARFPTVGSSSEYPGLSLHASIQPHGQSSNQPSISCNLNSNLNPLATSNIRLTYAHCVQDYLETVLPLPLCAEKLDSRHLNEDSKPGSVGDKGKSNKGKSNKSNGKPGGR